MRVGEVEKKCGMVVVGGRKEEEVEKKKPMESKRRIRLPARRS